MKPNENAKWHRPRPKVMRLRCEEVKCHTTCPPCALLPPQRVDSVSPSLAPEAGPCRAWWLYVGRGGSLQDPMHATVSCHPLQLGENVGTIRVNILTSLRPHQSPGCIHAFGTCCTPWKRLSTTAMANTACRCRRNGDDTPQTSNTLQL